MQIACLKSGLLPQKKAQLIRRKKSEIIIG